MSSQLPPVRVVQNAYVVCNLEEACRQFHDLYRIGPFFRLDNLELREVVYRGRPASDRIVIDVAFAQSGEILIELIAQSSPGPSAFRDVYAEGEQGLHHVATWSSDYVAERQAFVDAGCEIAMELSGRGDYQMCFIDARPILGHMIELYPDHPDLRRLYTEVRERTPGWDGGELILPL